MRKNVILIALIFMVPLVAFFAMTRPDASYATKNTTANTTGKKPQVIKFTSLMCLDCKKMAEVVKEVYPKYSDKINLVEVQVQSGEKSVAEQIKKYDITLVPTMVYISADGKRVKKVQGAVDKKEFEKQLKALING